MKSLPYIRKITAAVLTCLLFVIFASFNAGAEDSVNEEISADNKVVIIDDAGNRIEIERADVFHTVSDDNADDTTFVGSEEDIERILKNSKDAAERFNSRQNGSRVDNSVKIYDDVKGSMDATFDDDWSLILINKEHRIPKDYEFELATIKGEIKSDVRVVEHVLEMIKDAQEDGVDIFICSPYRSEEKQEKLFDRKVAQYTRQGYDYDKAYDMASETVAIPGTSEHQVGLAFDFVTPGYQRLDAGFADTEAGQWLAKNAPDYGFILRYPEDKVAITDIEFEPWHYRYVGVDAAKEITALGLCLEEYDEMIGLVE